MGSIVLPIFSVYLGLGFTADLINYQIALYDSRSIFNDTEFEESRVDILNATYYVLPGDRFPYSALGLPVDIVRRIKNGEFYQKEQVDLPDYMLRYREHDRAAVLFVTEYRTVDRSLKKNAVPVSDYQEKVRKGSTHYVETMHYGGRYIVMGHIRSNVVGDGQILRRIVKDIMGTSGPMGDDTIDLWNKVIKTVYECPDVRGDVYTSLDEHSTNLDLPKPPVHPLTIIKNISKFIYPLDTKRFSTPLYVTYTPLHALDESYPAVEKNAETEHYLDKIDEILDDLDYTDSQMYSLLDVILMKKDKEGEAKYDDFAEKLLDSTENATELLKKKFSIFKDINITAFKKAIEQYENGLDEGTKTYYSAYKKLKEDIGPWCKNKFRNPARGLLQVKDSEVVQKDVEEGGLKECQRFCEVDAKCRSFGYADEERLFSGGRKLCFIYYRSTNTATLYNPVGFSLEEAKVYDRVCV